MNEKIAKALTDANVVKFGKFRLASGLESPIYVDLRVLPSYPDSMAAVTEELVKAVKTKSRSCSRRRNCWNSISNCYFLKNKNSNDLCQKKA